ncbi:MAG TPA: alpha/beta fold hydrolase [Terriglobales bacterium]|jgi:pimeloyl-ACP methyl ester carboxylesterase|nr:alpha/beta fold hydrolase [Terriglobales bacterium]
MRRLLLVTLFLILTGWRATAQDVIGDWQGTLKVGEAELRLVLHIGKNPDGSLRATMDSIDQGSYGLPVSSISLKEAQLSFSVDVVRGIYEGKVSADASEISGTWSQGQPLPLNFKKAAAPIKTEHKPAKPSDIDGDWWGTLDTGVARLRLVFHIINTEDGLVATLDSLDQNVKGLPVTTVTRDGPSIRMELKQIAGVFEGKLDKQLASMEGAWTQAGNTWPLVLKRAKDSAEMERRRPQNPVKPYPYREEEVRYENKAAGVTLAGTLTIPQGRGPFPAVVLITGSGPQDRDETIMGHRPFLVLADYLTRKGIAVLRADDRGVGKSTGSLVAATTLDFASDAEAGVGYLKTRPEVDTRKIGLIGHSEGGMIAPIVAARDPDIDFIVMLAGIGVPGGELLVEQAKLISEASGKSAAEAVQIAAQERDVVELVKQEKDDAVLEKKIREMLAGQVPEAQLGESIRQLRSPWFRYFVGYDPAPTLRKVHCPVLAMNGEKDLQVPPRQNLSAIRKALEEGGNKHVEVVELPGLNHLFQTAKTGAVSEYAEIEETMSPRALETIANWVLQQ